MIVLGAAVLLVILLIIYVARGGSGNDAPTPTDAPTVPTETSQPVTSHMIDVSYLSQVDRYPCGCESVSAVMALNYSGVNISADSFIDTYLPQGYAPYEGDDGLLYADSPYEVFIGSPYDDYSYGCYAPVIKSALTQVLADDSTVNAEPSAAFTNLRVVDLSGTALFDLCRSYIDRDIPVIVWGTIRMQSIRNTTEWILPNGETFTWKSPEHCLLLVGYDEKYYYFNDPMEGKNTAYAKADAEAAYKELYSQALAIVTQ